MNSIEERYGCVTCKKEFCGDCEQGFKVLGAKEQKAIDDAKLAKLKKEFLLTFTFAMKAKEKKMIEKTCEWVNDNKQPVLASDIDDTIVGYSIAVEEFIEWLKTMEE